MFDVIAIGSATRDAFVKSSGFHIDPDHHVLGGRGLVMPLGAKLEIEEMVFSTGGGATNTAVTFARQGMKTAVIAMVGDDVSGNTVIQELRKEKVDTRFIKKHSRLSTGYSILLHPEKGGERTILVARGASQKLGSRDILWSKIKTRWFYISSLAGNLRLLRKLISFARKNKINIAYNPGGRELAQRKKLIPLLKYVAVLIANREEASIIVNIPFEKEAEIFKKWDILSPGINVMSDGRNGVWVSDGRFLYKAGIYKERKLVDRTGAGDAFGSGFIAGIISRLKSGKLGDNIGSLSQEDIEYAIKLGSANATAKVEGIGAKYGLLTKTEFEQARRWKSLKIFKKML